MLRTVWLRAALCACAIGCLPSAARADGRGDIGSGDGFPSFCQQWMAKLAAREQNNLASARFQEQQGEVVAEYVGYSRELLRCESRVRRPGIPGVGVMAYYEIRYRRAGADVSAARAGEPSVVDRSEVTEVFRYDGRSWRY